MAKGRRPKAPSSAKLDIHSLVKSNAVPTEEETELVRQLISEEEEAISPLQEQIEELSEARRTKQRLLEETRNRITTYNRFLSSKSLSARRLPPEIVQNIFRFCIDLNPPRSPPSRSPHTLAHHLAQICSAWREIALDTPDLWTDIVVELKITPRRETVAKVARNAVSHLRTYADRCKHRHYQLSISIVSPCSESSLRNLISDILSLHSRRISGLHLHVPLEYMAVLGDHEEGAFPNLKDIGVWPSDYEDLAGWSHIPQLWSPMSRVLETAPMLESFQGLLPPHSDVLALRLPWGQLTKLHLFCSRRKGTDTQQNVLEAFTQCKVLKDCILPLRKCDIELGMSYSFEHIRHLDVKLAFPRAVKRFGRNMRFPRLEVLKISPHVYDADKPTFPLHEFLALRLNSNFKLQELYISELQISSLDMLRLLDCVPTLHLLDLSEAIVDDAAELVVGLTISHRLPVTYYTRSTHILPSLRCFKVIIPNQYFYPSLLAEMVNSRGWSHDPKDVSDFHCCGSSISKLQTMYLGTREARGIESALWPHLRHFYRMGLSLTIDTLGIP